MQLRSYRTKKNPLNDEAASWNNREELLNALWSKWWDLPHVIHRRLWCKQAIGEIALKDSKLKKTKCYVTRKGLNPVIGTVVIAESW